MKWVVLIALMIALFAGVLTFLAGRDLRGDVLVIRDAQLLSEPYPLDYPSTCPKPNRVVATLRGQEVCVLSHSYEKDFHAYRVRTTSGLKGYIMDGPGVATTGRRWSESWTSFLCLGNRE